MRNLLLSCLLSLVIAAPAPQDVELIPDYDSQEPTLVFVRPNFGGFGRIPGFGQFGGFGDFPSRLPPSFGFEDSEPKIQISLSDIFGARPSQEGGRVPGIINSLFDVLGDHLGVNGPAVGQEREEGQQEEGEEYDHHNNTYEEKVLPDGSVVRVNRTVIKDTDEDGNSFYFSSSVHHVLQDGQDEEGDGELLDTVTDLDIDDDQHEEDFENEDDEELEEDAETVGEVFRDYENEAEFVPTDIDESFNEISDSVQRDREGKFEFPGLDASQSVAGLFE